MNVIQNQYLPPIQTQPVQVQQAPIQSTPPAQSIEPVKEQISQNTSAEPQDESTNYITFKAPIIGTFYRRPSPEKDAFVSVGDTVAEGSVLCIIEAMKLFNEIESEVSGKIIWVSENFSSGGTFTKGDTLIKLDSRDYELALVTAESNLSQSKVALQREIAESNIAKQEWDKVSDGEASDLALRKPQLAQANAFFAASEATYEQAKRNLNRTSIVAPFDGRVRKKNTDLGAIISPGIPLGMIYATDYVEVRLPIANVDLSFLDIPLDGTLIELYKQPQVKLFSKIFDLRVFDATFRFISFLLFSFERR